MTSIRLLDLTSFRAAFNKMFQQSLPSSPPDYCEVMEKKGLHKLLTALQPRALLPLSLGHLGFATLLPQESTEFHFWMENAMKMSSQEL